MECAQLRILCGQRSVKTDNLLVALGQPWVDFGDLHIALCH